MKIFVKVKAGAKNERVKQIDDKHYWVSVKEPPIGGRANEALIKIIGRYFGVAPTSVRIVHGRAGRQKIFDIPMASRVEDF